MHPKTWERMKLTQCVGKIAFPTARAAHAYREAREKHTRSKDNGRNVYRCPFCKQFHIGHRR